MDNDDKCPNEKGEPPDGCPPKDSDGDGVPDSKDKCPNVKGEPPDGCPADRDSDGDGIIDSKDKCPNVYLLVRIFSLRVTRPNSASTTTMTTPVFTTTTTVFWFVRSRWARW